ncbi:hypothetical protein ACP70R_024381 [Stipagrostis hirtigluma subsp. patula]
MAKLAVVLATVLLLVTVSMATISPTHGARTLESAEHVAVTVADAPSSAAVEFTVHGDFDVPFKAAANGPAGVGYNPAADYDIKTPVFVS